MRDYLVLARIRVLLPLEVPINIVILHIFDCDSAYKADNNFQALEGGFEARIWPFYKIWSNKDLTLVLWEGKSVMPQKKVLYKSGSEATMQT